MGTCGVVASGRRALRVLAVIAGGTRGRMAQRRGDEHALERVEVVAEIARVADADRVTLAAFDGRGDGLAADGRFDDVVHVADAQAVARGGFAVHVEVEEVSAGGALGEDAAGVGKIAERLLNIDRDVFDLLEVGAEDLDPERSCGSRW